MFNLEAGIYHNFILGNGLIVHNSNQIPHGKVYVPGVGDYQVEYAPFKGVENPKTYTIEQLTDPTLPWDIARFKGSPKWGATGQGAIESQVTFPDRFSWQNQFFLDNRGVITSFADIGPAVPCYAITTQEVRVILPLSAEVWAVDVLSPPPAGLGNVRFVKQSIVASPLTKKFKAIRMAHMAMYLSVDDAKTALQNVDSSLEMGGYLMDHNMIYQKTPNGFKEVAVRDSAHPLSPTPFYLIWSSKCNSCVIGRGSKIITQIPSGD